MWLNTQPPLDPQAQRAGPEPLWPIVNLRQHVVYLHLKPISPPLPTLFWPLVWITRLKFVSANLKIETKSFPW